MELGTLVALIASVFACIGVGVAIVADIRSRNRDRVETAEKRGAMSERFTEAEKDINRAHQRISVNRESVHEIEKHDAATATSLQHISETLEELRDLLMQHITAGHAS